MPYRNIAILPTNKVLFADIILLNDASNFTTRVQMSLSRHNDMLRTLGVVTESRRYYPEQFLQEDINRVYNLILYCNLHGSSTNATISKEQLLNLFSCTQSRLGSVLVRVRKILKFLNNGINNFEMCIKPELSSFIIRGFPIFPVLLNESLDDRYIRFHNQLLQIYPGHILNHFNRPNPTGNRVNAQHQLVFDAYINGDFDNGNGPPCLCTECTATRRQSLNDLHRHYPPAQVIEIICQGNTFPASVLNPTGERIKIPSFFKEPFKELSASIVYALTSA